MLGSIFWYGLGIFFILLIIFFILLFIKPVVQSYLDNGKGWYLLGFIIASIIGYSFGGFLELPMCFGLFIPYICEISIKTFSIVGFCILFWYFTSPSKEN